MMVVSSGGDADDEICDHLRRGLAARRAVHCGHVHAFSCPSSPNMITASRTSRIKLSRITFVPVAPPDVSAGLSGLLRGGDKSAHDT